MQDLHQQLKAITATLLSPDVSYNDIRMVTHALKDLFCNVVGFDQPEAATQKHIQTAGGQAINTYAAALCITDMMRTRKFLLGIKEAIEERSKTKPGQPVTILYAGSGPFATLLTPLTSFFSPEQLQMVLLEINPLSFHHLQKTIHEFGMEKYILGIENTDAIHYSIPDKYQPDILLSETMKSALEKEPQVSIIGNLLPQCNREPILIPGSIKVEACLIGNLAFDPPVIRSIQALMELDMKTGMEINAIPVIANGITVTIPEKPEPVYSRIALTTTVTIFGNYVIGLQESGITLVVPVRDIDAIQKYPASLLFRYIINEEPRFEVRVM